ncbi:MAG: phage tail tape measure protein, partial [Acinetobacter sp.]
AVAVGGAVAAGGMVLSNALQKPRDYQQQMTYIMATATGGQGLSTKQRLEQGNSLHQYVKDAVRTAGGTREDAAAALNELIASGKYDVGNVAPALNASTRTAFAAGADAVDAAKMTLAMQNFGVRDISLGQDRAMRAGQVGSFEYRDMAKFLPEQMAMAKASGYSGDDGLVKILALNQMAKTTASDSSSAGNNVVNLLQKLSSREFSDSIADAVTVTSGDPTRVKGTKKPKQVFDWSSYSIQQREQGVYGVEAFVKLLERQLAGNTQYSNLQAQARSAKSNEERQALLGDMSNIAMGSEMGQIIADRQALMAAMAAVYNKDTASQLESEISGAKGTVNSDLELIKSQEWAKDQAVNQEGLFAQSKAYDAVSGVLGTLKDNVTQAAQGNEALAAAAYSAATAVAALGVASAAGSVLGGGKGGAIAGKAGGLLTKAGGVARAGAGPAGAVLAAGAVGYGAGTVISKNFVEGTDFGDKLGETIAKTLAFFGNDEAKAALEAQAAYDAMLSEQQQANKLSQDAISEFRAMRSDLSNFANRPLNFNLPGGSLAESFGRPATASSQENRHGAPKPFMLTHTGR